MFAALPSGEDEAMALPSPSKSPRLPKDKPSPFLLLLERPRNAKRRITAAIGLQSAYFPAAYPILTRNFQRFRKLSLPS